MPSLIGTTVTANYLKTAPTTQFGTRNLAFYTIAGTGFDTNFADSNSAFSSAVRAIQLQAEIFAVGTPAAAGFIIVIADDTASDGKESDVATRLDTVVTAATGIATAVTLKSLSGITLA